MDGGQILASGDSVAMARLRTDGWCVVRDVLTPAQTDGSLDRLWMRHWLGLNAEANVGLAATTLGAPR